MDKDMNRRLLIVLHNEIFRVTGDISVEISKTKEQAQRLQRLHTQTTALLARIDERLAEAK